MDELSCGGTCSSDTRSSASTRRSASKVATVSWRDKGSTRRSRSASASSSGINGVRADLGTAAVMAGGVEVVGGPASEIRLRVVFEPRSIVDQPARHPVGVVQIQHGPQGGLGQL